VHNNLGPTIVSLLLLLSLLVLAIQLNT